MVLCTPPHSVVVVAIYSQPLMTAVLGCGTLTNTRVWLDTEDMPTQYGMLLSGIKAQLLSKHESTVKYR